MSSPFSLPAVDSSSEYDSLAKENARLTAELKALSLHAPVAIDAARSRPHAHADVHERASGSTKTPRLVVSSNAMQTVVANVAAVASTDASVLLYGETGTGKELIAAEIHERSLRRRARFVAQNLAALSPELMASELFGHVKGAFTGAQQARRGLLELAEGGTLFLDEIGEAPAALQAMLLRALESREFWPVGATEPRQVDVRLIAATNRDLLAEAHAGYFRRDLYYRLAVCPIEVPPLRARISDVRGIGLPLLEAAARRMNRDTPYITDAAWRALEAHPWPGNVRELGNVMERLVIYHAGRVVEPSLLALSPSSRTSHVQWASLGDAVAMREIDTANTSSSFFESSESSESMTRAHATPLPPSRAWLRGSLRSNDPQPRSSREAAPARSDSDTYPLSPSSSHFFLDANAQSTSHDTLTLDLPESGTTFEELERGILVQVLARADNNQSRAARRLNMSESTFRSRMKRLGIKG